MYSLLPKSWQNVFIIARKFIELLSEIFWGVVHIYLHLVLIFMINSESKNETYLLFWAKLRDD